MERTENLAAYGRRDVCMRQSRARMRMKHAEQNLANLVRWERFEIRVCRARRLCVERVDTGDVTGTSVVRRTREDPHACLPNESRP